MSWNTFGLPAESAAIDKGNAPLTWTESKIAEMQAELNALGLYFDTFPSTFLILDCDRKETTCSLEYYFTLHILNIGKLYHIYSLSKKTF